jgi:hypothetical protein
MAGCLPQIEALEQDIKTKLGVVQAIRGTYDVEKFRPEHNENETLYHATAYVPEILRDGFQAEPPEDRRGLGNYGRVVTISFTHDLEIARNIMRSLKEMWMIAHGELTGSALYRYWLAHSKLRSDPMMTSPEQVIEMMTNRDLTDIGVLACDVRLEPDDRYLIGEAEFRLPPDRVLSVKQVL